MAPPSSNPLPLTITVIVAALPPTIDGIGAYTAQLAAELARGRFAANVVLLSDRNVSANLIAGVAVRGVFEPSVSASYRTLPNAVAADRPDWVILQYNPFSYGRRGFNLALPSALAKIRDCSPGTRVAVMFHEKYVPVENWQFAIMTIWQRWQFRQIGRIADILFFSINKWAEESRAWFPGKPIYHLPVGSAMPLVSIGRLEARQRLGIDENEHVLGVFGSAHVSRDLSAVRNAIAVIAKAGISVVLLYIGPHGERIQDEIGPIPTGGRLIKDGPHSPEEVSRRLAAVDVFLAAYIDGVSTRRSAMMAALQHGLPVVGTYGINTDPELLAANGEAVILTRAGDDKAFADEAYRLIVDNVERTRISRGGIDLYNRRYAWSAITDFMVSKLT